MKILTQSIESQMKFQIVPDINNYRSSSKTSVQNCKKGSHGATESKYKLTPCITLSLSSIISRQSKKFGVAVNATIKLTQNDCKSS